MRKLLDIFAVLVVIAFCAVFVFVMGGLESIGILFVSCLVAWAIVHTIGRILEYISLKSG